MSASSSRKQSGDILIQELDRAGIEKAVMPGRVNSVIGTVPNDDLETIAKEYNGRFVPFVGVDPRDRKAAIAEIERCMKKSVFKGAVIEPGLMPAPWYLDDARLYPIYGYLEDNNIPLLFMAGGNAGPDFDLFLAGAHRPCRPRFPDAQDHLGPWQLAVGEPDYPRLLPAPKHIPLAGHVHAWQFPGRARLSQRPEWLPCRPLPLYASAYPFLSVEKSLAAFLKMGIKAEVKERVLYKNAAKLLGL